MAAFLRQGARRIGGAVLQRTQAAVTAPAVAEERRRLLPRRMTTDTHTREAMKDVKQMKEELYQVLCKDGNMGERGLLQDLAVELNPGPQDTRWRGLRVARRVGNFVETTGTILFASLVIVVHTVFKRYEEAGEREMQKQKQVRVEELSMEKQA